MSIPAPFMWESPPPPPPERIYRFSHICCMQRTQKQQELCEVSIKINNSYNKTEFEVGRWRITSKMYRKQMCPLLRGKTNSRSVELLQFFVPLFGKVAIFIINIFIKTQVIFIFGDLFIASNTGSQQKDFNIQ